MRHRRRSTLFPYTTLFRSRRDEAVPRGADEDAEGAGAHPAHHADDEADARDGDDSHRQHLRTTATPNVRKPAPASQSTIRGFAGPVSLCGLLLLGAEKKCP